MGLLVLGMRQGKSGQAAHSDEQKAEQKRYREQPTFVVDDIGRDICARHTDRNDGRLRKPLVEQPIKGRFTWFVQRSCRFIEKQEIRAVKKCARNAEPLLLAQ